jgi:hypothetical protein
MMVVLMAAIAGTITKGLPAFASVAVVTTQASEGIAPLPADPPIGGAIWTIVIPAILFLGSFLGTYLLYKRFSREEGG